MNAFLGSTYALFGRSLFSAYVFAKCYFFFSGIEKLKGSCVYSTNLHDEIKNLIIR